MKHSLIIPIYNEQYRIRPFLHNIEKYRIDNKKNLDEIIFVDDGSYDSSEKILNDFCSKKKNCVLISYKKNKGKGYAIKKGVDRCNSKFCIIVDSDNSYRLEEISKVLEELKKNEIVLGNKYIKMKDRSFRYYLGRLFNIFVNFLFDLGISDTFCGLKGMDIEKAKELFFGLKHEDWMFDVEILIKARKKGFTIKEIPVDFKRISGSKFGLFSPVKIFFGLLYVRFFEKY